jgi:CRISPR-associated endonuclease/helicase Cas3
MNSFKILLAKSYKEAVSDENIPSYARLIPHVRAVERAGVSIVEIAGELILQQLGLPLDPWLSRLNRVLRVASLSHDLGKANVAFQQMVRGKLHPTKQPVRHELLSVLLLSSQHFSIRQWALDLLKDGSGDEELLLNCVIGAVGGHHLKLEEKWEKAAPALKGGCDVEVQTLLTHPDMASLIDKSIVGQDISFSLVYGQPNFIGDYQLPFNINSNSWIKKLKGSTDWWRFAATLKALLAAADVAGSAMLPEKEPIRKWVHVTLSNRISSAEMMKVAEVRLDGKKPRKFQEDIGQSSSRITLVEAGCGTGKTVAAYLWAAKHAQGKKLFFCYPTTGTATEGFLGYVHETDIEAKLMHSRAIVDLEGIAEVDDEDDKEHRLRIESLSAWSPKVIVCTADTVLSLVRNNRRGLYNSPAILSGSFVFDELHAYTPRMLEAVLALIKALPSASFLLMTASLPRALKQTLLSHLGKDVEEIPSPKKLEEIPRYEFQRLSSIDEALDIAINAVKGRQKVLWICNTVSRAQKIFQDDQIAKNSSILVKTYHSRFKYEHRVDQHRSIIKGFKPESPGMLAITTQVAEMSLDLDADLVITEVAPMSALIQRLGRLNRRVEADSPGTPRKALFLRPEDSSPYEDIDLTLAEEWIDKLISLNHPLSQTHLSDEFNQLSPAEELRLNTNTEWLDSGWHADPREIREAGYTVPIILPEDEQSCRASQTELIKRSIPMNFDLNRGMKNWREFKGHLIAPEGMIHYDKEVGAIWV